MKGLFLAAVAAVLIQPSASAYEAQFTPVQSNFIDRVEDKLLADVGKSPEYQAALRRYNGNRPYFRRVVLHDAIEFCTAKTAGKAMSRWMGTQNMIDATAPNPKEALNLKIIYWATTLTASKTICH